MADIKTDASKIKFLVRIHNTDLEGNKQIHHALTKIKGVGRMYAKALCVISGIDPFVKAGLLPDLDVAKLNEIIKSPSNYGMPVWLLNRRKDPETGADHHILTTDLDFVKSNDIKQMQKIKCYKGVRHYMGQPVRGQRTRSNFRKNKGKVVGVSKKKVMPAADSGKKDK